MKIKCKKETILSGFQQVQSVVSSKSTLPVLSNVLIETDEDKITLYTTDLEVGMKLSIPATILEPGESTLPAKRMYNIIKELSVNEFELAIDEKNTASITSGSAFFKVIGLPREEFPKIPEFDQNKSIVVSQKLLRNVFRKTAYAISRDETRYVLNGLYLSFSEGKVKAVATDGRRLAFVEESINLEEGISGEMIIPAKAVNEVSRILGDDGDVRIYLSDNQIAFKVEKCLLISRLIEGHYPNYKQVIPESLKETFTLQKEELFSAVRRVSTLTSEKSNSIKLKLDENKMVLSVSTPELGEAKEEIPGPYAGDSFEIAFNPVYMIDVLKNIDEDDIQIGFNDSFSPGVIRVGESFLYVIMPMKLS